jgi:predicted Zn-dependent protease
MLGKKRIQEITGSLLARSTADQTEVVILAGDSYLTRFAHSAIHQNVAESNADVRIRCVLGKRLGVASTNDLNPRALERTLDHALAIARLQPENPEFQSLPGPLPIPEVKAFSETTAGCSAEDRARSVGTLCSVAGAARVAAFGALTTAVAELAVANSLGTLACFPVTYADLNMVAMSDSSAGYGAGLDSDFARLDFEALGREAVEKCVRSRNPKPVEPGEYTVILEPYAAQDLVQMLSYTGFNATALQEGRSFMVGKIGQRLVDARVSIWDDGLDAEGIPWPFDFEGVPRQRVDLLKDGVASGVVYDSYRAGKEGRASTGHALPSPNPFGPLPLNTFFSCGEASLEEMVKSTERGIYITRFHYTRPVEPMRVVVTGMTRDGTFLIEKGEIAYPVKNLRFTQSYLQSLDSVESIGRERRLLMGMMNYGRDSVPALKLSGFNFTGVTEF